VLSAQPHTPVAGCLGAFVGEGSNVVVACLSDQARPLAVTVTLAGVRRGVTARFPVFTEEQARQNQAFWDRAVQDNR
jgi:hypothetical protein